MSEPRNVRLMAAWPPTHFAHSHSHTHSSPFLQFFFSSFCCHREDEHDWRTTNNGLEICILTNLMMMMKKTPQREKSFRSRQIKRIRRNIKEPTDSTRCLLKAFWDVGVGVLDAAAVPVAWKIFMKMPFGWHCGMFDVGCLMSSAASFDGQVKIFSLHSDMTAKQITG